MERHHRLVTLFWAALGIFVAAYSYRLGLGKLLEPGPGLMPFALGTILCLLALCKLVGETRSGNREEGPIIKAQVHVGGRGDVGRIAGITLTLLIYALLLEVLGYIVTTFLVMAFLFRFAGYRGWPLILLYAAIIAGVTYFGFTYLGTRFPPGILSLVGLR
jgi:putative tricarboxylic transport membrane protein